MELSEVITMASLFRHAYDAALQPVCAAHSLTRLELDILLFLEHEPTMDTARDLAYTRCLSKSHISLGVATLLRRGLITAARRDGNRKTLHLSLTEAAEPILADGRRAQEALTRHLLIDTTGAQLAVADSLTALIRRNLHTVIASTEA